MKKLFLLFIFSLPLYAQYTHKDTDLVRTTFAREFDREIIIPYLESKNPDEVKAALLSIANSNDSNFIDDVIKPDFKLYGDMITFALGELGPSFSSTNFLLGKIYSYGEHEFIRECYDAIGRTGDKGTLELLTGEYFGSSMDFTGLPLAIVNFFTRNIKSDQSKGILVSEIKNTGDPQQRFDALYALYRLGGSKDAEDILIKILKLEDNDYVIKQKLYALGCLRRIESFPGDFKLLGELVDHKDWRIRCEAARVLCYYDFRKEDEFDKYLTLIRDPNPNVSRQAAISVKNVSFKDRFDRKIKIMDILNNAYLTENALGELFISYCSIDKSEIFELIKLYESKVEPEFIYRVLESNPGNPDLNFAYLKNRLANIEDPELIHLLNALLPLQKALKNDAEYVNILINALASRSAPAISIVADGLDSLIILRDKGILKNIIDMQVRDYFNNADYLESLQSLARLAKKISNDYYDEILNKLKESSLLSVKEFALKSLGENLHGIPFPAEKFNLLWGYAFTYAGARIVTEKGDIIIEFNANFAPITVGNFCALTNDHFYDKVIFHRVVPNFVIQTGDPTGTGWGGPGYDIISEFSPIPFDEGYVGMASAGKDTEGSQWFIMHSSYPHLNGRYTNFARVLKGMEVVNKIDQGNKIISIELLE